MIKQRIANFISNISPKLYFQIAYYHHRKHLPNLANPKDLSEIWIKKVLDGKINDIYYLADKFLVRDYIEMKGLGHILTPLITSYTKSDQVNLSLLPNKFALKANYGAGMNIICTDKSLLNQEEIKIKVNKWLTGPSYSGFERHYNLIERRVICEEFIDDGTGGFPIDYKFICIKGKVNCILVCADREKGEADYLPYSKTWEPLYSYNKERSHNAKVTPCPSNLSEMLIIAERLAENLDLVRVDLYSNGEKVWFGEMTLTPAGCIFARWSQLALDEMGKYYFEH